MLAIAALLVPLLAPYVPGIVGWLGGDDAEEAAAKVVGIAQSVTGGATDPTSLAAALSDPVAASQVALKLAEVSAQREAVRDQEITDRLKAAMADTADARQQTVALAAANSPIAWAPVVVSVVIVAGFFACLVLLFIMPQAWDERTAGLVNMLFGALTLSFGQVCNYWLGSSRGSAAKDERAAQTATTLAGSTAQAAAVLAETAAQVGVQRVTGSIFGARR